MAEPCNVWVLGIAQRSVRELHTYTRNANAIILIFFPVIRRASVVSRLRSDGCNEGGRWETLVRVVFASRYSCNAKDSRARKRWSGHTRCEGSFRTLFSEERKKYDDASCVYWTVYACRIPFLSHLLPAHSLSNFSSVARFARDWHISLWRGERASSSLWKKKKSTDTLSSTSYLCAQDRHPMMVFDFR